MWHLSRMRIRSLPNFRVLQPPTKNLKLNTSKFSTRTVLASGISKSGTLRNSKEYVLLPLFLSRFVFHEILILETGLISKTDGVEALFWIQCKDLACLFHLFPPLH